MDDEFRAWSKTWKALEEQPMNWLQRAQSAHRSEAVVRSWMLFGVVVCALIMIIAIARACWSSTGAPGWPQLTFGSIAVLIGLFALHHQRRQIIAARSQLTVTPLGFLQDLVRLRQRELDGWLGKWSLLTTGILALGALALALSRLFDPTVSTAAWGPVVFVGLSLGALIAVGMKRVRDLRSELTELRKLQRELAGD